MKDYSLTVVSLGVLFAHAAALFLFYDQPKSLQLQEPIKKLIVKTVLLEPPNQKAVSAKEKVPDLLPTSSTQKEESKLALNPSKPREPAKRKESLKASPPAVFKKHEVKSDKKQKELFEKAQESLAKIKQSRDKLPPKPKKETINLKSPNELTDLQVEQLSNPSPNALTQQEVNYRDELAGRLKLMLKLPEYGEVKIQLTLNRSGQVKSVEILSAESTLNSKYVEKMIPSLTFPSFGHRFQNMNQYTFALTLRNES